VALDRELGKAARWDVGDWDVASWDDDAGTLAGDLGRLFDAPTRAERAAALEVLAARESFVSTWVRGPQARAAVARLARRADWLALRRDVLRWAVRHADADAGARPLRAEGHGYGTWQPHVPRDFGARAQWLRRRAMAHVSALLVDLDRDGTADSLALVRATVTRRRGDREVLMLATLGGQWVAQAPALLGISEKTLRNRRAGLRNRDTIRKGGSRGTPGT
jgi:hypothetical protein